jgi:serine/threonine protein kinase
MDTDRNLLFGVLALQADLLDKNRFAEACSAWATQKDTPLADLLVERGWLTPEDRSHVEYLLDRKLKKHNGDARASLAEVTTDPVRLSLVALGDAAIHESLAGMATPPAPGHVLLSTTAHMPGSRDRYTLSRLHATGGIGRVWLARDNSLGRDVALKELRPERCDNTTVWSRFLKEAQITGQLEHPGVVPIYEVGQRPEDHSPFYTMRFVRGRTMAEAITAYHERRDRADAAPLELRELLTAFIGVCNAVGYAHSRGVLHRDLKPQNVVLGDYGEVIVLDWGLARLMDQPDDEEAPLQLAPLDASDGTIQGQVLGTPAYMAPEQAEGRLDRLGPATDVYGLGAILYEILTGSPPFKGNETTAVLRQVVHAAPVRPRVVKPATPRPLEAICLKALAKKPTHRYGSAKALANDIQRWLADEPVKAYRDPALVRLTRWARKHRTAVAIGAGVLQTAVIVLAVSTLLLSQSRARIEEERRAADAARAHAQAVNNFLIRDLLAQADPQNNPVGDKVTVHQLLDKAAGALETSPSIRENPEVEGSIRSAIGNTYYALGLYQRAREELEKAVACQELAPGVPARERIFTKNRLAWVTYKLGNFDEKMARAVFEEAQNELGREHEESVYAADTVATIMLGHGNQAEAFGLYRDNLAIQRRILGPNHRLTVRAAFNLADGLMYNAPGDDPQNLAEAEKVMLTYREAAQGLGPDDPEALQFESDLGFVCSRLSKYAEAHKVLAPLQERFARVFGPDHLAVALYDENLALAEEGLGHLDTATSLLQRCYTIRQSRLGDGHGLTRRATAHLGRVCMARGKTDEAVTWLRTLLTAGVVRTGGRGISQRADKPTPPSPTRPADEAAAPSRKVPDINALGDALAGRGDVETNARLLYELAITLNWLDWRSDWLRAYVTAIHMEAALALGWAQKPRAAIKLEDSVAVMEANPTTPPRFLEQTRAALKRVLEQDEQPPR